MQSGKFSRTILVAANAGRCVKMALLFVKYLAIYINEKLSNCIKISQNRFKILTNTKLTLSTIAKVLKISQSGEILTLSH